MAKVQLAESFPVTEKVMEIVHPAGQTPSREISLSDMDLRNDVYIVTLMTYEGNDDGDEHDPEEVLRDALANTLVYFYALAGRIRRSSSNEGHSSEKPRPRIICEGQGALFVRANADCTLHDIGYLDRPLRLTPLCLRSLCPLELPPTFVPGDSPLLRVQVTRFKCGGFVIGTATSHMVVDGTGVSNLFQVFGEFATTKRNAKSKSPLLVLPDPVPVWDGRLIPRGRPSTTPFMEGGRSLNPYKMSMVSCTLTPQGIQSLKKNILFGSGGALTNTTTFEALTALIWTAFMRSSKFESEGFYFPAGARGFITPSLPEGYAGNCVVPVVVKTKGHESMSDVARAIRKAKEGLCREYVRSYLDYLSDSSHGNGNMWFHSMMGFYKWTHFKLAPNFGWGEARNLFILPQPRPETFFVSFGQNIRVHTFLPAEMLPLFTMQFHVMEGVKDVESCSMSLDVCPMPLGM